MKYLKNEFFANSSISSHFLCHTSWADAIKLFVHIPLLKSLSQYFVFFVTYEWPMKSVCPDQAFPA
jgi:hypothetical protein